MATAKKLPSGSWRCQVFSHYEIMPDGRKRPRYESFTCSDPSLRGKKECERMAAQWSCERAERAANITVNDAINKYIDAKEAVLSPSTIRGYRGMLRSSYASIGDAGIRQLTDQEIQLWVSELSGDHGPKTVRNAYGLLSSALVYFKRSRPDVTLPARAVIDRDSPEDQDVQTFIKHLSSRESDRDLLLAVLLAGFCGMRRSEICGLTAEDITATGFYVHRVLVRNSDGEFVQVDRTKTPGSTRIVQAPQFILDMVAGSEGRLVKCSPKQLSSRFGRARRYCARHYGFYFRFHDLRHYYASVAHALGIPDQYIMEMGGWKTDHVMKRVYRNTMKSQKKEETAKLESHFADLMK